MTASPDNEVATLRLEAEKLRNELANEKERAGRLEFANRHVTERLDAAIRSVKDILARQG